MAQTSDSGTQATNTLTTSFSPLTCLELVDSLSAEQLLRELKLVLDETTLQSRETRKKQLASLKAHFAGQVATNNDKLTNSLHSLTSSFSRAVDKARSQMDELQDSISTAQKVIDTLQQTGIRALTPLPQPSSPLHDGSDGIFLPCEPGKDCLSFTKLEGSPFDKFDLALLDSDTVYDKTFSNRKVAYYGDVPYKYVGGHHQVRNLATNPYLAQIGAAVEDICSGLDLDFKSYNSVMITKYDSASSCIPPHSDDEPSIMPGSVIFTVSLGETRRILFRRKPPGSYCEETLESAHGEAYCMSRESQDFWDHSVPRISRDDYDGPRISITFRALTPASSSSTAQSGSTSTSTSTAPPPRPKRKVLVLSDSKNASFDCSLLRDPVACFRENLFYLRDLNQHRSSIEHADLVLISAGVNDIRHNHVTARTLHDHVKSLIVQFPRTEFLFDSVSPLSMWADPRNSTNNIINELNELLLHFSVRTDNFKLFENVSFGLPHLARDGLHFNQTGKEVLSCCWVNCVLARLGVRRGNLTLSHRFRAIVSDFNQHRRNTG